MACSKKNCSGCGSGCNHNHGCSGCGSGHRPCIRPGCGCGSGCGTGCSSGCNSGCGCRPRPPIAVPWLADESGFGLLRGVPGPGRHHHHHDWDYPYYTGPCGPCDPCNPKCCSSDCGCGDACCWGRFTASAPLNLEAGGSVPFRGGSQSGNCFTPLRDGLRLNCPGSYMVICTLHVPANETVSSRFVFSLNGQTMDSSAMDVSALPDGSTSCCTLHTLLDAEAGDLLQLISLSPVSVCPGAGGNVFSLSILKIC